MTEKSSPLSPFFQPKFLKFCTVGASGVLVNLVMLAVLREFGLRSSFASAWAIEVSIISNFLVNEYWTFRDQRGPDGLMGRLYRFQLVSLVGGLIQWTVFIAANVLFLLVIFGDVACAEYFSSVDSVVEVLSLTIQNPPDIGAWVYASQLTGIGVATFWNYLANFYWTWRGRDT